MTNSKTTYTCPMHPEVASDQPGNCPKCGMKLVPKEKAKKNRIWMILACLLPLLVIILLPLFGVKIDYSWVIVIVLAACCVLPMLFMRHRHSNHS